MYDNVYGAAANDEKFAGWTDSYSGDAIPLPQMEEWLQCTLDRILALKPRAVLEVGFGTGMIIEGLCRSELSQMTSYFATDISSKAMHRMTSRLKLLNESRVKLAHASAENIPNLWTGHDFDTIIINSVAQYFPSEGYLKIQLFQRQTESNRALSL